MRRRGRRRRCARRSSSCGTRRRARRRRPATPQCPADTRPSCGCRRRPSGSRRAGRGRAAPPKARRRRSRTGGSGGRGRRGFPPARWSPRRPRSAALVLEAQAEGRGVDRAEAPCGWGGRHSTMVPGRAGSVAGGERPARSSDPPQHRAAVGRPGRQLRDAAAVRRGRLADARRRAGRQGPARARARDRARLRRAGRAAGRPRDGSLRPRPGAGRRLHRRRAGCGLAALGSTLSSAPAVLAGLVAVGASSGTALLARTAAGDMYPPERRAHGIALVLFGAVFGAILGPFVFSPLLAGRDLDGDALAGLWLAAGVFMLAGLVLVLAVRPDPKRIAELLRTSDEGGSSPGRAAARDRAAAWRDPGAARRPGLVLGDGRRDDADGRDRRRPPAPRRPLRVPDHRCARARHVRARARDRRGGGPHRPHARARRRAADHGRRGHQPAVGPGRRHHRGRPVRPRDRLESLVRLGDRAARRLRHRRRAREAARLQRPARRAHRGGARAARRAGAVGDRRGGARDRRHRARGRAALWILGRPPAGRTPAPQLR